MRAQLGRERQARTSLSGDLRVMGGPDTGQRASILGAPGSDPADGHGGILGTHSVTAPRAGAGITHPGPAQAALPGHAWSRARKLTGVSVTEIN